MNKDEVLQVIVGEISSTVRGALAAADQARATATDKENVAENKYDTLGLEAAYLAHGQSERVLQLGRDLALFESLQKHLKDSEVVEIGSLVQMEEVGGSLRFIFLGPASGGLVVNYDSVDVTVVTPISPLGRALLGAEAGDSVYLDRKLPAEQMVIAKLW